MYCITIDVTYESNFVYFYSSFTNEKKGILVVDAGFHTIHFHDFLYNRYFHLVILTVILYILLEKSQFEKNLSPFDRQEER